MVVYCAKKGDCRSVVAWAMCHSGVPHTGSEGEIAPAYIAPEVVITPCRSVVAWAMCHSGVPHTVSVASDREIAPCLHCS